MTKNLSLLEDSVKLSHHTERMIFQTELQLLIDNHLLDFELDREKWLNSSETIPAMPRSDNEETKYLRTKCQDLTAVVAKRSSQIGKALAQVRDLKKDKKNLILQIKEKDSRIKEMSQRYSQAMAEMNEKIGMMKEEADRERKKYSQNVLQTALQEQIRQNKQLIYNNCQLKTQIAESKTVDRFNKETQVSSGDVSRYMYFEEVSG